MIAGAQGGKRVVVTVTRVVVTDFGAVPDSRKDATAAIRQALAACKSALAGSEGRGKTVLVFPKGRYDLYADSAVKKEYFISNTSSETECPSKVKTIGILLEDMKDLTIEGEGSLLLFHGKMITFALDHCERIVLRDLAVDFERPTMSEFTIIRSTPAVVEVQVHPDSWYRLDSGRLVWYGEGWIAKDHHCIRVDTVTHAFYYANEEYEKLIGAAITSAGPFRLRFQGVFDTTRYLPGNVFTVRDPLRDQVGAFIVNSKDVLLRNVAMHYMHGLGIVSQYSENISMDSVVVEPRKGSGRWIASFADGMHFSGCRGQIRIEHCRFNGLHDDAVNVHGTHLKIVKKPADDQLVLRFMHPQTYGFRAFFEKDSVAFVHPATLVIYAYGVVKSTRRLSDREILVTLEKPVPSVVRTDVPSGAGSSPSSAVGVGDVAENITWTPRLTFRHNVITGTNTRGVLVTTRRKVVIEKNEFYRLGMHAILIADDALSWYESGAVRDVLIRGNVFKECGHNILPGNYAIAIAPENHELIPAPVHRNIRIGGNRFYCYSAPVLTARSVEGLSFRGNTVSYVRPFEGMHGTGEVFSGGTAGRGGWPSFRLVFCRKVVIGNNRVDGALPGRDIKMEAMGRGDLRLGKQEGLTVVGK